MTAVPLGPIGTGSGRRNQYFLPGEGIEREVIQSDICRYLDHDATVKPGQYNGDTGYLLYAYRNLTSSMVDDLKATSAKWRGEREQRDQRNKSNANNKRKHGQPASLSYIDSTTHGQTVQRFEEQERLRTDSPHSDRSRGFAVPPPPSGFTGLPTPVSQRGDAPFLDSPSQPYPITGRMNDEQSGPYHATSRPVQEERTPPHMINNPDLQYPHASRDGRPNYDSRYPQDQYRQEPYSQTYSQPYSQQPNTGRPMAQQQMPPPPLPMQIQQMPRASTQPFYDPYAMDTDMDTRPDPYREQPMNPRSEWPDNRIDPRVDPLESRMSGRGDPRLDSRVDPRMDPYIDPRSNRPDIGPSGDVRSSTGMGMRQEPRADPRIDPRTATRMGMRPEPRQDTRYDGRGDPRDVRDPDPRSRAYPESDRRKHGR